MKITIDSMAKTDYKQQRYYLYTSAISLLFLYYTLRAKSVVFTLDLVFLPDLSDCVFGTGIILFAIWLIATSWYHGILDVFLYTAEITFSLANRNRNDREKRDLYTYSQEKKMQRRRPIHFFVISCVYFIAGAGLTLLTRLLA